jgi:DDB1- and CUL4-associated factor 13
MVKIKTISRTEETSVRKTKTDITKVHRNRDPSLHHFERAREYTKALTATKLDKMFAKPFIAALDGHKDTVYCCSTVRNKNVPFISGACDGEVKVWDLGHRTCVWSANAHRGFVRGVCPDASGTSFFSVGDDKIIKQWALNPSSSSDLGDVQPLNSIISPSVLMSIDHHWVDKQFATCGDSVNVWDATRGDSIHSYKWGADTINSVKFNPAEACLLGSTASDNSVVLYDLRSSQPMKKMFLPMRSNKLAWNPMEPMNFLLANEDHNVYSFDMRKLDKALMIHKDHVSAVMDVAFSPTGREFVAGSYDRTLRMFKTNQGRSRDVYHTKRMQRIYCVGFSSDARFILSGSDDTNVRVWKADSSDNLGVQKGRQDRREQVRDTIKKRYAHMPEIRRITTEKRVPRAIKKAGAIRHIQSSSVRRKQENRAAHNDTSHPDKVAPERKKVVVANHE